MRTEPGRHRPDPPLAPSWLGGRHAVAAALDAGCVDRLALAVGAGGLEDLEARALRAGVPTERVARAEVDRRAAGPAQGCAALCRPPATADLQETLSALAGCRRVLLVACDHILDPHNLGAIARTAEAAGAAALIVPDRRAAGLTPVAQRASAGALHTLPCIMVHNLAWALQQAQARRFWIYGAAPDGEVAHSACAFADRAVLVVGAEGRGLSPLVRRHCDQTVRLPVHGRVQSLNASVAAGILMYEWLRPGPPDASPGRGARPAGDVATDAGAH